MSTHAGITGQALEWFRSYLSDRSQAVIINNTTSSHRRLSCGVPQGSVLGPLLFTIYTLPLGNIMRKHLIDFEIYADDDQIYITFKRIDENGAFVTKERLEHCLRDIKAWMTVNWLMFNGGKTELLVLGSRFAPEIVFPPLQIGNDLVTKSESARNLGVLFDSGMSLETHITNVSRSAAYEIHKLGAIRKYLDNDTTEILVRAFVSSRLDYCNSLYAGLPQYHIDKLQRVQNMAARIVTRTKELHITPVLYRLHWLPVNDRINFKIAMFVYKAIHGLAPSYLRDLIEWKSDAYPSRGEPLMLKQHLSHMVNYGDRAFSVYAPCIWNALPFEVRSSECIDIFRRRLKTHFFQERFV
jgi:hypothetical protein